MKAFNSAIFPLEGTGVLTADVRKAKKLSEVLLLRFVGVHIVVEACVHAQEIILGIMGRRVAQKRVVLALIGGVSGSSAEEVGQFHMGIGL